MQIGFGKITLLSEILLIIVLQLCSKWRNDRTKSTFLPQKVTGAWHLAYRLRKQLQAWARQTQDCRHVLHKRVACTERAPGEEVAWAL